MDKQTLRQKIHEIDKKKRFEDFEEKNRLIG